MERKKNLSKKEAIKNQLNENPIIILFIIFYLVGIIWHIIPLTRKIMFNITPYVLLISSIIIYIYFETKQKDKFFIWVMATYFFTFAAEVIGANFGLLFGKYSYLNNLGFKLFNVPIVIGFNWIFVTLGAILIALKFKKNIFITSLVAALITVLFDIVLEPAAIKLQYWSWKNNSIPIYNYITWFVLSFIISYFYLKNNIYSKSLLPAYFLLIQTVFFSLIIIFM